MLPETVNELDRVMKKEGVPYELILVDDGSTDHSWHVIQTLRKTFPFISATRFTRRFGKEAAIRAGCEIARGDCAVIMDADLQHPPSLIPQMLHIWKSEHADVVEAVKNDDLQQGGKRWYRNIYFRISKPLTGLDLRGSCDFKLLDKKVLDSYLRLSERSLFFRGLVSWFGYKTVSIPFTPGERSSGKSKWPFWKLARLALTSITSFSSALLHIVTLLGFIFVLLSALLGIQTIYNKIAGNAVSGFTTVILLLLIIGSAIMLALGVIGEYLALIYNEVKRRPLYCIDEKILADSEACPQTQDATDDSFENSALGSDRTRASAD